VPEKKFGALARRRGKALERSAGDRTAGIFLHLVCVVQVVLILILVTGTIAITVAVRLLNLVHSDSVMTALDLDLHLHASSHKPTKANQEVAKDAAVKNAWYTLALIKLVPPLSKNIQMLYKRTYCQTDMVCHMLIRLLMGNEFLMSLRAFSTMPRGDAK